MSARTALLEELGRMETPMPSTPAAPAQQPADTSLPAAGALAIKTFGITDRGKVRVCNEDQFLIAELSKAMRVWQTSLPEPKVQTGDDRAHLLLVADGMGGARAGERASATAVAAIEQFMLNSFKWFYGSSNVEAQRVLGQFQSAFKAADERVLEEAAGHPELMGMGTTVTMAFQLGAQLCVLHAGDSRAYIYRDDELQQLTQDHTVTAEMVRNGSLRPEEAGSHRLRHVITNVIGGNEAGVRVECFALEVRAGDRLLLCTDGLTEMVSDEEIAATLSAENDPEAATRTLLDAANERGGRDNITIVIARFDAPATAPASAASPS